MKQLTINEKRYDYLDTTITYKQIVDQLGW